MFEPFVQTAIQKRLQQVLLEGLKKNDSKRGVDPLVIAAAASWAIYGAVIQWVHAENRASAESFADVALQLVGPMLLPRRGRAYCRRTRIETGAGKSKGRELTGSADVLGS